MATIITWTPGEICDFCGEEGGAYEFLGDFYCKECLSSELGGESVEEDEVEIDAAGLEVEDECDV